MWWPNGLLIRRDEGSKQPRCVWCVALLGFGGSKDMLDTRSQWKAWKYPIDRSRKRWVFVVLWCHQGPSLTWPSIHCTLPVKDKKLLRHRHSNDSNVPPRNTQLGPTCKRYKEVKMRNEARKKKNISLSLHVIPFHSSCFLAFVEKLIVISCGLNFQLPNARKLLAVLRRKTYIYIYVPWSRHGMWFNMR